MSQGNDQKSVTVVVWGDSIAASGWPQIMEHTFNACCNTGAAIRVVNSGKGGNPAARAVHEFNASVLAHRPAVVFIQFGFNDQRFDGSRGTRPISTPSEFGIHLAEMIRLCREETSAQVIVFGNHRSLVRLDLPSGIPYDETVGVYRAVAACVAEEAGVLYVDMSQALSHPDIPFTRLLADDGVHLSELGKQGYARVAVSTLLRLPVPLRKLARSTPGLVVFEGSTLLPDPTPIPQVEYPGKGLQFVTIPHDNQRGFEDIRPFYQGTPKEGLLYARGYIATTKSGAGKLLIGADGPFKVFVNRREVACNPQATNPISQHVLPVIVTWKKGRNEIVLAMRTNAGNAWGFMIPAVKG